MVQLIWLAISGSLGLMCFLLIPMIGRSLPLHARNQVAQFFYGLAARAIGQPAIIRRSVGGYSLMEWQMDDELGAGKVVLDDSMLGDSKELHFDDPDNRLKRWKSKPLAVLHEDVPGVVDAEIAEYGKRWREHVRAGKNWQNERFNPYFTVPDIRRCVNVDNVKPLILHGSEPSDAATIEDYTRKRFEKYHSAINAETLISMATGAGTGFAMVGIGAYVRDNLLDSAAGETVEVPLTIATDVVVTLI